MREDLGRIQTNSAFALEQEVPEREREREGVNTISFCRKRNSPSSGMEKNLPPKHPPTLNFVWWKACLEIYSCCTSAGAHLFISHCFCFRGIDLGKLVLCLEWIKTTDFKDRLWCAVSFFLSLALSHTHTWKIERGSITFSEISPQKYYYEHSRANKSFASKENWGCFLHLSTHACSTFKANMWYFFHKLQTLNLIYKPGMRL